ncbi:MAG: DEAD/DEAH box helicase family protein [Syntrophomonas sp.]
MIEIKVSNQIIININSFPSDVKEIIFRELTLQNPNYLQAEKYGYSTRNLEEYLYLYTHEGENLIIPRGYVYRLFRIIKDAGHEYRVIDQRLTLPPVDFNCRIRLRLYQVPAARALYKWGNGGLVAPCGSGKTEIMLVVMGALKQPALWVTHTKDLLDQVVERAVRSFHGMTREEIGIIAEGKVTVGERFTVALVQTLSRVDLAPLLNRFGAIFIDEGHHLPARSFLEPISQFPAKYRIWCSATPEREDGLTKVVKAAGGPVLCTICQEDLPTLIPRLIIIETAYTGFIDPGSYPKMLNELTSNEARNRLIVDTVAREAPGHYSLILSDRIEHLTILKAMLEDKMPEARIEILTGQLPKKKREGIMEQARAREVDILLATNLAREGLDLPHLDRLFMVTPKRAPGATEQELGRIKRPCECKQDATVYDFWDINNPIFKAQFWKRRAVYEKLGIKVDFQNGIQRIAK